MSLHRLKPYLKDEHFICWKGVVDLDSCVIDRSWEMGRFSNSVSSILFPSANTVK